MRIWPFVALSILTSAPALADTVYLTNGRSFEGVLAEVSGSKVNIRMQGGVLSLPLSQVSRIENSDSSLAQYLVRRDALTRSAVPTGAGWLELAVWAQAKGMAQASREAALTAARIDPHLPGLSDLMRQHGYVLDESLGNWILYGESMRRKGFVQSNGEWVARAELEAAERARDAEREQMAARRMEAQRAAREDRLAELTALALAREVRRADPPPAMSYYPSVIIVPGFVPAPIPVPVPQDPGGTPAPRPRPRDEDLNLRSTFTRVPGSLIPGRYPSSGSSNPR